MRNFQLNPALAAVVAGEYAQPALVPASPWLETVLPGRPKLAAKEQPGDLVVQWSMPGTPPASKWLVQFCGPNHDWKMAVLPGYQNTQVFSFSPQFISVRAIDRADNLGTAAVIGRRSQAAAGAAPALRPAPAPTAPVRSFWSSFPKN
ncbi:MAG TPA: hypothetical protein VME24_13735, partial [Alphaproteobacteria bacterium]|nr:hypothetical protein [Alphaproteobacteria bacterium]